MTDREAFEAWISGPPYEHEVGLFGDAAAWPGNYRDIDVDLAWQAWKAAIEAIRAHLAQQQGEPAWHDAPNAPGVWVVGGRCLHINELDLPIYARSNCRWYGPIPDDGGKP